MKIQRYLIQLMFIYFNPKNILPALIYRATRLTNTTFTHARGWHITSITLPFTNTRTMWYRIGIQMTNTIIVTITYTGIVFRNRSFTKFTIPLIGTITHGYTFDDMTGATILTNNTGTRITLRTFRGITDYRS